MRSISLLALLFLIISSCALNKTFLHPWDLSKDDQVSAYVPQVDDTLTLGFNDDYSTKITNSSGEEETKLPYTIETIFFENRSGDSLYAWFMEPKENYNGTTIYFLHGNAANLAYQIVFAAPFVEAGYQVFIFDYSGFGFSQGESTRKVVKNDATDGLNYLMSREDIKYDHLLIYGQSLGGHLSVVIANENQDKIDGLVTEGAFSSHSDIAADVVPVLGRIFTREMYSAEKNIVDFKKPILIIHSTEDERIPYDQGERLFELANEPKEFYSIDKLHIRGPLFYADSITAKMARMVAD
ncbi:MAG: alpha/beta hydrolase [Crocinitomicaceae bacterium]|nr:alpha/beta hydrolase [Crocinitomicaceae bacterium]